ncbi:MAG: PAS domain-containing protein [Spirochaetota bacterium]
MIRFLLRITLIVFMLICLIGGISLVVYNTYLINNHSNPQVNIEQSLFNLNIIIIIAIFIGLGLSVTSILFLEIRGTKIYNRIVNNIDIANKNKLDLSTISFPETDEMGNLGEKIMVLIKVMSTFDKLKKAMLNKVNSEFDFIFNTFPEPIIMLDNSYNIIKVNKSFNSKLHISDSKGKNIFDIMEFEDCNLKNIVDSYEKHSINTNIKTYNQRFNTNLILKRFTNPKENDNEKEYIIIFSSLEVTYNDKSGADNQSE